jgi:hypothetical protein
MRMLRGIFSAGPLALLVLAGCTSSAPSYKAPAADSANAATVYVGKLKEQYSVSQNKSWIQIVAVDGQATGHVQSVRVTPGEHQFTIRHHDPHAMFYGNARYADIKFKADAGGSYRIDASYKGGFYLGQFDLVATDEQSGSQIAVTLPASQVRLTGP